MDHAASAMMARAPRERRGKGPLEERHERRARRVRRAQPAAATMPASGEVRRWKTRREPEMRRRDFEREGWSQRS